MQPNVKPKVFLSYSYRDKEVVQTVRDILLKNDFEVATDFDIKPGDDWGELTKYRLEASDVVLVLITKSLFNSGPFSFRYEDWFFETAKQRNILLIPVILENTFIPNEFFEYQMLDLTEEKETGIATLVKRINAINDISFEGFTGQKFQELTLELLKELNFKNIRSQSEVADQGLDFTAEYFNSDPFGRINKEMWLIETKYYKEARFDIQTIKKIVELYKYIPRGDAKLLLVTNSQLTSIVKEYLYKIQSEGFIDIAVINGFELKNIIANAPLIQTKFFSK